MSRHRVQAIIIQDKKFLFGYGCLDRKGNIFRHFFVGGGLEEGECTEEAVIREIVEEANVTGNIVFKFNKELEEMHTSFLVDMGGQNPTLGYDPEEIDVKAEHKVLQKLIFIPLNNASEFTDIDIDYFKILLNECEIREYYAEWYNELYELVASFG